MKIDTILQILFTTIILFLLYLSMFTLPLFPDKRIVVREDELYEVELRYGMRWCEMGGPYKTIQEARDKIKYWEDYRKKEKANDAIKRKTVE